VSLTAFAFKSLSHGERAHEQALHELHREAQERQDGEAKWWRSPRSTDTSAPPCPPAQLTKALPRPRGWAGLQSRLDEAVAAQREAERAMARQSAEAQVTSAELRTEKDALLGQAQDSAVRTQQLQEELRGVVRHAVTVTPALSTDAPLN
jgi:hypothetical protein